MSDFLNPLGGRFVGPSGPVAPSAVAGTIPDPPRGFRQLDPGTIIKGVVLGRESDGLTAIATDKGTVRVASNALLPAGAQVTLEVRPTGDRLQVLILANDAVQRGAPHNTPAPTTAAPQVAPGQTATAPTQPSPGAGTTASGSDVRGADTRPPSQQGAPAATTTPTRGDRSSIQFVGSSLRAVVVQAPPLAPGVPIPAAVAVTVPAPSAAVNAAPLQAALIAATEKKDRSAQPASSAIGAAVRGTVPAAKEASAPDAQARSQVASPETEAPAGVSAHVPAGTAMSADVRLRILALFASVAAGHEGGAIPQAAAEAAHAAQPVPGKAAAPQAAQPLPIGANLKLRVLAVQMQLNQPIEIDPIAMDPHDARAHVIFGRVVSITPAGHAVIHTPVGDIMMQDRSSLAVGARLALAIDTLEAAPPAAAIAMPIVQTPQQALISLAQSWPTLADLIAIFQGSVGANAKTAAIDPEIARQALALLPHAGNKLGAGMMNAMAALRSGDIGKLLGPLFAVRGAGLEREEMVRRLRSEFAQLSALAQDRPDVDWRALFLPILDDQGRITQINLFYRRPKKSEAADRSGGAGTRFVVEADFSRLGPFQLDGLMRKQRFDLMVRSRNRLTDRMRLDIEAIYEEARGLTGFAGAIAFQTVNDFPVIPLDDLKRTSPKVTI